MIFFDIVDETQSIRAKAFFRDKADYLCALDTLRTVERIQVRGDVRFDTYADDLILFAMSAKEIPVPSREDISKTKRVELHVHTQMSEMDSVVPTEKLIQLASRWGWAAIAITDHGVVQAFPKAMKTIAANHLSIKVIYGIEGSLTGHDYKEPHANHIMILAKNEYGLRNLYQLVSLSHLQFFHDQPRIPKHILEEHRNGLLLGASACAKGELVRAIAAQRNDDELLAIAGFYDYLEIQPIGNYTSLIHDEKFPGIHADEDLRNINRKIAELAKKLGKILVATGNVHFLNPEDAIYRAVIQAGKGIENTGPQPPLFLRTTEEMLKEFGYLGEDAAYEAVVANPRRIADMIERLQPLPASLCLPTLPNADDILKDMAYQRAHQWYGKNLPAAVQERLDWELDSIIGHGFSVLYLIAHKLTVKSNADGHPVGSRGAVGSSLVATMTGITDVNPLPPHWRCPKCQYSEFVTGNSYNSGFDLPEKNCPNCGEPLTKDGHNIPAEIFLGCSGGKIPDIDLNFTKEYHPVASACLKDLFGDDHVCRAGIISTVTDKTAYGYTKKYFSSIGEKKRFSFMEHIAKGCVGTKKATGQNPRAFMIVPQNLDILHFTPLQHPSHEKDADTVMTHYDFQALSECLAKIKFAAHEPLSLLKKMEDLSRFSCSMIPFDDSKTLSLFRSTEALDVSSNDLGMSYGTLGIPEFQTSYVSQILDETHPTKFDELVKISALSHGTDTWLGNARNLMQAGVCTLRDIIATPDDILSYLMKRGIDPLPACKTAESVGFGTGIPLECMETLQASNVPKWYIESCQKIKYLFPRAHAVSYVMTAFRIAYYKAHFPLAFYGAYFSLCKELVDVNVIAAGIEAVQQELTSLEAGGLLNIKQNLSVKILHLAREMYLRGYSLTPANFPYIER